VLRRRCISSGSRSLAVPTVAADFPPEVDRVGGEEQQAEPRLDREGHQAQGDLDDEDRQEPPLVPGQPPGVAQVVTGHRSGAARVRHAGGHPGLRPRPAAGQQHHPGDPVRDRGQSQRAAHRGAHADVLLLRAVPEHDSHEGDHAFRQRGAEGREDGADREPSDVEPLAQPFHGVDEPLAGQVDHRRAGDEKHEMDHGTGYPLRVTRGMPDLLWSREASTPQATHTSPTSRRSRPPRTGTRPPGARRAPACRRPARDYSPSTAQHSPQQRTRFGTKPRHPDVVQGIREDDLIDPSAAAVACGRPALTNKPAKSVSRPSMCSAAFCCCSPPPWHRWPARTPRGHAATRPRAAPRRGR
jgi:hypothetical protein